MTVRKAKHLRGTRKGRVRKCTRTLRQGRGEREDSLSKYEIYDLSRVSPEGKNIYKSDIRLEDERRYVVQSQELVHKHINKLTKKECYHS